MREICAKLTLKTRNKLFNLLLSLMVTLNIITQIGLVLNGPIPDKVKKLS